MNAVSSTGDTPIDYAILHALEEDMAGNDSEIMLELIDIFLDDSPARLDSIGQAMEEGDLRKAEINAHSLKSSAATFGALGLSTLCQRMELCARTGQQKCLSEALKAARLEFASAQVALREQRAKWAKAAIQ